MIYIVLLVGLCLGSFVNALVWRLHEQNQIHKSKNSKKNLSSQNNKELSILNGRSMCPNCRHQLSYAVLIPLFSWLALKGKCRYCHKPISWQYPAVELLTAILFVFSYIYWPMQFNNHGNVMFGFWLAILTGLIALAVYDIKWFLLPNRIMFPLLLLVAMQVLVNILFFGAGWAVLVSVFWGIVIGGGIFYGIFQVSKGKWIGGGDVKLGALLGIIVGGPWAGFLLLFISSLLGTFVTLPLLATKKLKPTSKVPFGPFLIMASVIVYIFGTGIIDWYKQKILLY